MSFLHPGWFMLCLILPLIVLGAVLTLRSRGNTWKQFIAPRLQSQLVRQSPRTNHWISLSLGMIGCLCIIACIARPYSGETSKTEEIHTRNILIAVDTSRSMLVQDGSPDRIASAKTMALELTNAFPNDRVGLIAFSSTSVLLAPLTIDHSAIKETIAQLDTDVIPSGGSDLISPIKLATKTFNDIGHHSNALIIISDGESHNQTIPQIPQNDHLLISTIAVGSSNGGIIPDSRMPDGKFRDVQGNTVLSKMQTDTLTQMAQIGGGVFEKAGVHAPSAIYQSFNKLRSTSQAGRTISIPNEIYPWFLIPGVLMLIASAITRSSLLFTTNTAPIASLLILCLSLPLYAETPLETAKAAYENQDYASAIESFDEALTTAQGEEKHAIQFCLGSSAYKLKKWHQATKHYSHALLTNNPEMRQSSHYNLGNSLFQTAWSQCKPHKVELPNQQTKKITQTYIVDDIASAITRLEDAIGHYTATLELNPDHKDASHNRSEAEELLNQLKNAQQNEQSQQDQPKQGDGNQKQPNNQGEDQNGNQQKPENNQGENPKTGNNSEEPSPEDTNNKQQSNEKQQPDDQNQEQQQQPGESDQAYAARILKENADAETRPVKSRLLRIRRPSKDW